MKTTINNDAFWTAVEMATGMAQREAFIITFVGHSFVTYDDGTIWSPSLKAAFGPGAGLTKIQHHYRRGCDINEVITELNITNVGEYYTDAAIQGREEKRIIDAAKTVADFELMATYEWQEPRVREQIMNALNDIVVNKEFGRSIPESINGYSLTIKNYCEKEEAILIVDLTLTGRNSRKTAGYYKAAPIDIEAIVTRFTNERVASYTANLECHKKGLARLIG